MTSLQPSSAPSRLTNGFVVCGLAMLCCVLWGSAFPCIKIGYAMFHIGPDAVGSQLLFAGMRFTLAGIFALVLGSLSAKRFLVPKKQSWPSIFKLCLVQTVAQYLFFYIGLANTTGVKASILEAANVFLAILIPCLLLKQEKLTRAKLLGCFVGFAGVVLINLSSGSLDFSLSFLGDGFILLSAASYAFSSILVKGYSKTEAPFTLSGYQFILGGIILMLCGGAAGGRVSGFTPASTLLFIYLALISAVAYSLWATLLKYNPIGNVAIYGFMNPVCGVILSAILLKESSQAFGIAGILALVLVCIGIYLVSKAEPASAKSAGKV